MWQVLDSETEIVVRSGYIYAPLPYDAQIEAEVIDLTKELAGSATGVWEALDGTLSCEDGDFFVKSLRLNSLVDNYQAAFPEEYQQRRDHLHQEFFPEAAAYQPIVNPKLKTILFEVLPHFRRPKPGRWREKNSPTTILADLAANLLKIHTISTYLKNMLSHRNMLQQGIRRLESLSKRSLEPVPVLRGPAHLLRDWCQNAVHARLVQQELEHWQQELQQVQDLLNLPKAELAALMTIADGGAVEVDYFGCFADRQHPGEYWVYLRTGDFVLQDYFGRLYLFPDCRVAVSTAGPRQPLVLETYKHPLLRRFASRQQICLNDYHPEAEFSAGAIIRALEEGVNALFYGYNSRKRNGYNSLDRFSRHHSVVDFDDWRISLEDPRVLRGEVEVKNKSL
jgi:hypothetical protein